MPGGPPLVERRKKPMASDRRMLTGRAEWFIFHGS
jgi:hypothetical protein